MWDKLGPEQCCEKQKTNKLVFCCFFFHILHEVYICKQQKVVVIEILSKNWRLPKLARNNMLEGNQGQK